MAWTIACYCGNIYTAPPDRCQICGSTLEPGAYPDSHPQAVDLRDVDADAVLTLREGKAPPSDRSNVGQHKPTITAASIAR